MKFKRILSLLLVLFMILSITACGIKASSDDDDDEDGKKSSQSSKDNDDEDDEDSDSKDSDEDTDEDDKDKDDEDEAEDDKEATDKDADDDNPYKGMPEVDLPDGFPKDAFPIFKGGKVYNASADDRNNVKVYSAWIVFDSEVKAVDEFYKNLLKDAEGFDDQSSMGFTVYTGKLEGFQFNFTLIADSTNDKYSVLTLELTEIPTVDKLLESLENGELPENFPAAMFPIVDGGVVYDATESESDGKVSYGITIYTDKSFKDIVAFYEEKLGTIEDKSKSVGTDDFDLRGTVNNFYFSVYGGFSEENGVQLTRYYLNLDPISE